METEKLIETIAANVPRSENVVIGEDGLKRCAVCGDKVETIINLKIGEIVKNNKVPCVCRCKKAEMQKIENELKEDEKRRNIERLKIKGFPDNDFKNWNFDNDDGTNDKITTVAQNYVENFKTFKSSGKGLLFYGNVGTGKTYTAACIANALLDQGTAVLMTNFSRIINHIQNSFEGRNEYLDGLNEYDLLILDDLAAERQTEFMLENIYNVIDNRYRANKPLIITTNLTIEQLKNPATTATARIYDRILEKCFPVEVAGKSHRRQKIAAEYNDVKNLLGL